MQELTNSGSNPTYTYYSNYSDIPAPSGNNKKFRLLAFGAFALAFLFLLGGSTYAAYTLYFDSPARLVANMFAQFDQVRFSDSKTQISMEVKLNGIDPYSSILGDSTEFSLAQTLFQPPSTSAQSMNASIKGSLNGKVALDDFQAVQKADVNLEFSADGMFNMTNSNAGGGFTLAMDLRQPDPENIFLRLTKVPQLGLFDTNALVNKWIKYPTQSDSFGVSIDKNKQEELTKKLTDQVQALWEKYRPTLFVLARGTQDKTINQIRTKHISYTIDVNVLKPFLKEIFEAYANYNQQLADLLFSESSASSSSYYNSDEYLQSQTTAREKQVNDIINSIQQISGNIWIGSDSLPYAYDMQADFSYSEDRITSEVSIKLASEATSYNQDFSVESPPDAVTPEELFSQLQPTIDPEARFQDSQDARLLSSAAQLRVALEMYYAEYGVYPQRLSELNDFGYRTLVQDIQSSGLISYRQTEIGKNYQMCVTLSDLSEQCTDMDQNIRSGAAL